VSYAGSHSGLQVQKDGVGVQDIMDRHSGISRNSVRKYLSLLAPAFPKATLLILRNPRPIPSLRFQKFSVRKKRQHSGFAAAAPLCG